MMHNFKELSVWQKARELNKQIYLLTKKFPREERYAITQQIQRSCVSIASNIAEGSGRGGSKEFVQFLHIAISSSFELETQIILARDLSYIAEKEFFIVTQHIQEIDKMIHGLIRYNKPFSKTLPTKY